MAEETKIEETLIEEDRTPQEGGEAGAVRAEGPTEAPPEDLQAPPLSEKTPTEEVSSEGSFPEEDSLRGKNSIPEPPSDETFPEESPTEEPEGPEDLLDTLVEEEGVTPEGPPEEEGPGEVPSEGAPAEGTEESSAESSGGGGEVPEDDLLASLLEEAEEEESEETAPEETEEEHSESSTNKETSEEAPPQGHNKSFLILFVLGMLLILGLTAVGGVVLWRLWHVPVVSPPPSQESPKAEALGPVRPEPPLVTAPIGVEDRKLLILENFLIPYQRETGEYVFVKAKALLYFDDDKDFVKAKRNVTLWREQVYQILKNVPLYVWESRKGGEVVRKELLAYLKKKRLDGIVPVDLEVTGYILK